MAEWAAKRFWSEAAVSQAEGGYAVRLDARAIRTPAGRLLTLPTRPLAAAVAEEWLAQGEVIDPRTMPVTRAANSALDKVAVQRKAVIEVLQGYGGTDLLCYRADGPAELVGRESEAWDPLLAWADERFGARLRTTPGVMPTMQETQHLTRLAGPLCEMDVFVLTGFHDLVTLSGSLVIALAVWDGHLHAGEGWRRSRIDEEWQAEVWGHDAEAAAEAAIKRQAFLDADRLIDLSRG